MNATVMTTEQQQLYRTLLRRNAANHEAIRRYRRRALAFIRGGGCMGVWYQRGELEVEGEQGEGGEEGGEREEGGEGEGEGDDGNNGRVGVHVDGDFVEVQEPFQQQTSMQNNVQQDLVNAEQNLKNNQDQIQQPFPSQTSLSLGNKQVKLPQISMSSNLMCLSSKLQRQNRRSINLQTRKDSKSAKITENNIKLDVNYNRNDKIQSDKCLHAYNYPVERNGNKIVTDVCQVIKNKCQHINTKINVNFPGENQGEVNHPKCNSFGKVVKAQTYAFGEMPLKQKIKKQGKYASASNDDKQNSFTQKRTQNIRRLHQSLFKNNITDNLRVRKGQQLNKQPSETVKPLLNLQQITFSSKIKQSNQLNRISQKNQNLDNIERNIQKCEKNDKILFRNKSRQIKTKPSYSLVSGYKNKKCQYGGIYQNSRFGIFDTLNNINNLVNQQSVKASSSSCGKIGAFNFNQIKQLKQSQPKPLPISKIIHHHQKDSSRNPKLTRNASSSLKQALHFVSNNKNTKQLALPSLSSRETKRDNKGCSVFVNLNRNIIELKPCLEKLLAHRQIQTSFPMEKSVPAVPKNFYSSNWPLNAQNQPPLGSVSRNLAMSEKMQRFCSVRSQIVGTAGIRGKSQIHSNRSKEMIPIFQN